MVRPTAAQLGAVTTLAELEALRDGNSALTDCFGCRDCTTLLASTDCVRVSASRYCVRCEASANSSHLTDCQRLGQSHHCSNCTGVAGNVSQKLYGCNNCNNCDRCVFCDNLTGADLMVCNVAVTVAQFNAIWVVITTAVTAEQAAEDAARAAAAG